MPAVGYAQSWQAAAGAGFGGFAIDSVKLKRARLLYCSFQNSVVSSTVETAVGLGFSQVDMNSVLRPSVFEYDSGQSFQLHGLQENQSTGFVFGTMTAPTVYLRRAVLPAVARVEWDFSGEEVWLQNPKQFCVWNIGAVTARINAEWIWDA